MKKFTLKQWVAIVVMELIILLITAFFIYQFVAGYFMAKDGGTPISPLAIFCLVMGIVLFFGLNILMIFFIKKQRERR